MAAIAKNRRFAKIHLKTISSETAGPTLSQVSDYRLLGASSLVCSSVCPVSLCECNSSEVIGLIASIFGKMIGHDV